MQNAPEIRQVVCVLDGDDGNTYAIAACADETLVITCNGKPVARGHWLPNRSMDCVQEFYRLTGHARAIHKLSAIN